METLYISKSQGNLHSTSIGHIIASTYPGKAISISSSGAHKVTVVLSNGTRTILLTFDGEILPPDVDLFFVKHHLELYIPPTKMCFNCFRYGHIKDQCRSKTPLCERCGKTKHEKIEDCPNKNGPKCINCSREHLPKDKSCPVYLFQRRAHSYAAQNNSFLQEACSILRNIEAPSYATRANFKGTRNPTVSSPLLSNQNFPTLATPPSNLTTSPLLPQPPANPSLNRATYASKTQNVAATHAHPHSSTPTLVKIIFVLNRA